MKATTKKEIVKDDFAPNYVTDFVNNLGLKMFETNRLLNRFMLAMIKLNESNNEKYKMENAYHETVLIEKQRYCQQIKIQLDRLIEISAPDIIINNHLERLVESNKVLKSINDKSSVEFYNDFIGGELSVKACKRKNNCCRNQHHPRYQCRRQPPAEASMFREGFGF